MRAAMLAGEGVFKKVADMDLGFRIGLAQVQAQALQHNGHSWRLANPRVICPLSRLPLQPTARPRADANRSRRSAMVPGPSCLAERCRDGPWPSGHGLGKCAVFLPVSGLARPHAPRARAPEDAPERLPGRVLDHGQKGSAVAGAQPTHANVVPA
jgi:hypothetical protein